ncbi:MAG: hypothetical protein ABFS18_13855 [Thermodesulfobacteriota bacterium]
MKTLGQVITVIVLVSIASVCSGATVTGQITKITNYAGRGMQIGDKWINSFPDDSKVKLYDNVTVEYNEVGIPPRNRNVFVKWVEIHQDKPTGEIYPKTNLFAKKGGKKEGKWHVQVDPDCIGTCNADLVVLSEEDGKNLFKKFGDEHITGHYDFDGKEIKMYNEKGQILYAGKLLFTNNAWIMKVFGEKTTWSFKYAGSGARIKRVE